MPQNENYPFWSFHFNLTMLVFVHRKVLRKGVKPFGNCCLLISRGSNWKAPLSSSRKTGRDQAQHLNCHGWCLEPYQRFDHRLGCSSSVKDCTANALNPESGQLITKISTSVAVIKNWMCPREKRVITKLTFKSEISGVFRISILFIQSAQTQWM